MSYKTYIKKLLPPILLELKNSKNNSKHQIQWEGSYSNWDDALANSSGYDNDLILEKVKNSLLKVKNGEAVYERDSVLFDKIQYSWPLLACLQNVAINHDASLSIIDFGGSLGSSYFQNRYFLKGLVSLKWFVVEQDHFVSCGKKNFEDDNLKFAYSVDEVLQNQSVHCLLLSSVLQYLPDPFMWMERFLKFNFDYIIIDRTGFSAGESNVLTVQTVPAEIYQASYPCWFFNEKGFIDRVQKRYEIITDFNDSFTFPVIINRMNCYWKGFYLRRK
jgi:putative methyltransferase (TIGR04325 family)